VDDSLETRFIREILPYEGALMRYLTQRRVRANELEDVRNEVYVRTGSCAEDPSVHAESLSSYYSPKSARGPDST
jgi:hypothetical protein